MEWMAASRNSLTTSTSTVRYSIVAKEGVNMVAGQGWGGRAGQGRGGRAGQGWASTYRRA